MASPAPFNAVRGIAPSNRLRFAARSRGTELPTPTIVLPVIQFRFSDPGQRSVLRTVGIDPLFGRCRVLISYGRPEAAKHPHIGFAHLDYNGAVWSLIVAERTVIEAVFSAMAAFVDGFGHRHFAGCDRDLRAAGVDPGHARGIHAGGRGGSWAGILFFACRRTCHAKLDDWRATPLCGVRADCGLCPGDPAGTGAVGAPANAQPGAGVRGRRI